MTEGFEDARLGGLPITSINWQREGETVVFRVRGEATPAVFMDGLRALLADPTPCVLWDLRGCRLSGLGRDQLRRLVSRLMRSDLSKRRAGRSAFVCGTDEDRNVMRLLVAYAEASDYGIELAVFGDLERAERWLEDSHPAG
ncbi:MAG TPA: hypothetical protein VL691_21360 [Vicinamibacteria bacterium]|nr:hypothetical protein [Vicinamibacteria bacterium]